MSFYAKTPAWNRGQAVEAEFEALLKLRDPEARRATQQEQFDHIDFISNFGTFDVKALGRVSRGDTDTQDERRWLELNNVAGRVGWLLAEKLDYLAFERADDFIIVRREDLKELAKSLCQFEYVDCPLDALYNLYQRRGRKDLLTVIRTDDILALDHRLWAKS